MTGISVREARSLIEAAPSDEAARTELFAEAARIRRQTSGDTVSCCSIINARCGGCPEDCAFCPQSSRSKAEINSYPLLPVGEMLAAAKAAEGKSKRIGIVTSGRAVKPSKDLRQIADAVAAIATQTTVKPCASLGIIGRPELETLKAAGLTRYHHNLETSESHFPEICGTRTYKDQTRTVEDALATGLSVCSGGIFGLGESTSQRVEMLDTIRKLGVQSVPLNFLIPVKGTRLENQAPIPPIECLTAIAVAKLMMPNRNIRVCGGRIQNLRDMQSWIFAAGADSLMIGGYLTTTGRPVEADLAMIADAGLHPEI